MKKTSNNLEYFAAIPPEESDRLADEMREKIRIWRKHCDAQGFTSLWSRKLRNYYGSSISGSSSQTLTRGGSEGELTMVKVNDLHSLIQEQLVIVTSQRPAGVAKAINSDTKSLKAARIGTAIAEYYMSQGGFEGKFVNGTEAALLCDESFFEIFWDKSAGDPIAVDPDSQKPVMSGDALLRVHCTWNVARDIGATIESNNWYIVSYKMNKFDAAASYDRFYDHIISIGDDDLHPLPMNTIPEGSDEIYVHLLIHDRTPSVQNGRYALMIGDKIVVDSALPYKDFPVERMAPSDVIDGNMGYASANDILALEEITDALHSIVTTNQVSLGGQCIVGPEGANIKVSDLAKGVRYFELPPDLVDKLKPLQLARTPPEIFNYIGMLNEKKGKAVGSVSGILSQQAAQGASGSSMALIQTQAISYNSGTQRSFFKTMGGVMTKLIGVLRVYADTPRVASIVGKTKSAGLKEFKYTGHDLGSISSIVYEIVNPIFQTYGGRLTAAQDLLKAGQIKSPKQYINLVATGQADVFDQDDEADGLLILEENEWLMEGKPVRPLITQQHADHIKSHTSQITLEAQVEDPDFVGRVLDHIQEHINLWQQASASNPGILMATNQQPLMPPPPQMPPPQVGAPVGAPGLGPPPVAQKAAGVTEPNLPNLPGTTEKPTIPGVTDVV
jgi:hypothetical protein